MSLHTLANHLQSAGRGEDKVLVHMTPGEVNGLQSIAMAHGGSLSVNPETGLPEAGFLSSILPMIAGFALGPAGIGLTAMQAGVASAALGTVLTGDLKKGIMAGIGAYGGAGLGAGLMSQGAQGAAGAVDDVALASKNATANSQIGAGYNNIAPQAQVFGQPNLVTNSATPNMGLQAYTPPAPGMTSSQLNQSLLNPQVNFATGMNPPGKMFNATDIAARNSQIVANAPVNMADPNAFVTTNVPPVSTNAYNQGLLAPDNTGFTQYKNAVQLTPKPTSIYAQPDRLAQYKGVDFTEGAKHASPASTSNAIGRPAGRIDVLPGDPALAQPQSITGPFRDRMAQLGRGFEASTKDFEGLKGLYNAMPQYSVVASGIALADALKPEPAKVKKDKSLVRPYEFAYSPTGIEQEPYTGSAERTYFQPTFTALTPYAAPGPEYAAKGGLMGYAVGGSVERMSAQNAIGANTGYPMANINTPMYSNPAMQRPEATNVIAPSADAGVGTYSGEARFARGGEAKTEGGYTYSYDPTTMQFTQTGRPQPVATGRNSTPYSEGRSITNWNEGNSSNRAPVDTSMPANGAVTGGIAQPVMQSVTQPTSPSQPLIPNINIPAYQTPEQQLGLGGFYDYMNQQLGGMGGYGGYAAGGNVGGLSSLGGYSDGGRLLKGPGDGVSDSIPASIGNRQPARLADGEFVVPARIVSEIGNGSTEAGARKLYAMMDRVQRARRKTVGKGQVARNTKAEKLLPA
jgi:hypothetical protein